MGFDEKKFAAWAQTVEARLNLLSEAVEELSKPRAPRDDEPEEPKKNKKSPWDLKGGADKLGEFLRG